MISGQRAFKRNTGAETMTAILHEEPQELLLAHRGDSAGTRTHRAALHGEAAQAAFPVGARHCIRSGVGIGNFRSDFG